MKEMGGRTYTFSDLKDYQKEGVPWLKSHRYALLADYARAGKTPQILFASEDAPRMLVVCPAIACLTWKKDFAEWLDRRDVEILTGQNITQRIGHVKRGVISYDLLTRHTKTVCLLGGQFDLVVGDESHYAKELTTARTQALLGAQGLLHQTKAMWLVSGTPAPNNASELWPMLFCFGHTKLGYRAFVERYCNAQYLQKFDRFRIIDSKKETWHEVAAMLSKCMLRRPGASLPPVSHQKVYVEEPQEPLEFCSPELRERLQIEADRVVQALNLPGGPLGAQLEPRSDSEVLSLLATLAQSVSSLRRYHGLKKVRPTVELIAEELAAAPNKKIVVFGFHRDVLGQLCEMLNARRLGAVLVTGKISKQEAQRLVHNFKTNPATRVFVGNIQSAGTNIDLSVTNELIFIEHDWVPGNNEQAASRVRHIASKFKGVNVRHITLAGSLDEKISAVLARKTEQLSNFVRETTN